MHIILGSAEDIIKKLRDDKILIAADTNEGSVIYINGDKTDPNNKIDVEEYIGTNNPGSTPQKPQEQKYKADDLYPEDVVIYDPSESVTDKNLLKYTSPEGKLRPKREDCVSGNGAEEQTIDASVDKITRWYVFENDGDGVVTLISEDPGKKITLGYQLGFVYAEQELHKLASVYGHGKYAKKIENYEYTVGNPDPQLNELQTLNIKDLNTAARSLTMKDLEYLLFDTYEWSLEDCYGDLFENEEPNNLSREEQITKIKKKLTIDEWKTYNGTRDSEIQMTNNIFNTNKWPIVDVPYPSIDIRQRGKEKKNFLYTYWSFNKNSMDEICKDEFGDRIDWGDRIFNKKEQFVANRMVLCYEKDAQFIVPLFNDNCLLPRPLVGGYYRRWSTQSACIRVMLSLDLKKADITKNSNGEWIIK